MAIIATAFYQERHNLALELMDVGAMPTADSDHPLIIEREGPNGKERGFKLRHHRENPNAPLSPFFFNLRMQGSSRPGPLTTELVDRVAECMRGLQIEQNLVFAFDAIVGIPRAGTPFARSFAPIAGVECIPMIRWEHGEKRHIASPVSIPANVQEVLVIDDVVSEAGSKLETIEILRSEGVTVDHVMVLVDREQGGREKLTELNCELHSVFSITELLDIYVDAGKLKPEMRRRIHEYRTSQI